MFGLFENRVVSPECKSLLNKMDEDIWVINNYPTEYGNQFIGKYTIADNSGIVIGMIQYEEPGLYWFEVQINDQKANDLFSKHELTRIQARFNKIFNYLYHQHKEQLKNTRQSEQRKILSS